MRKFITLPTRTSFRSVAVILSSLLFILAGTARLSAQCNLSISVSYLGDPCAKGDIAKLVCSGAPSGSIYYWNTGNGNVIGSETYYYGFDTNSTKFVYDVHLKVKMPNGDSCMLDKPALLNFTSLSDAKMWLSRSLTCLPPDTVSFEDRSTGVNTRKWYVNGAALADTAQKVTYTFNTAGSYTIKLEIHGYRGCVKTVTQTVVVPAKPTIDFKAVMDESLLGKISANFKPIVGAPFKGKQYIWDFGDGTPTYTTTSPSDVPHVYSDLSKTYDVTLTVVTENGCKFSFTKNALVMKYYSIGTSTYCASDYAVITLLGTGNGKGSFRFTSNFPVSTISMGANKYGLKFGKEGKPKVSIIFQYSGSNVTDELNTVVTFTINPPVAGFDIKQAERKPCSLPANITLTATADTTPTSGTNTYTWRVFDSLGVEIPGSPFTSGSKTKQVITLTKPGFYSVREIVTNTGGCKDSVTRNNIIKAGSPAPVIEFLNDNVCVGDAIHVKNRTSPKEDPSDPYIHSWEVKHADSANILYTYNTAEPDIIVKRPGVYNVTYKVSTGLNCSQLVVYKEAIHVNGTMADIGITAVTANCAPYDYKLTANIAANYPVGSAISSYKWEVFPSAGVQIGSPTSASTSLRLPEGGCYTIQLTIVNSAGCTTVVRKDGAICVGTVSSFTIDTAACTGKSIIPNNTSSLAPDFYKWVITPSSGVTIIPSATSKSPSFLFNKDGCYSVMLLTGKNSNPSCTDTSKATVCVRTPKADFSIPDTLLYCQPQTITFKNLSVNGRKYTWVVSLILPNSNEERLRMDSFITTSKADYTYFVKHNGYYDIKLIVSGSSTNCESVLLRKKLIHVVGPQAYFTVDRNTSCGNQLFTFTDSSKDAKRTFIQYGDLSPASDIIGPHYYQFVDYSLDSNVYYPTIFAINEEQCASVDFYTKPIILYRPPQAGFNPSDTMGCSPFTVTFENTTKYGDKYIWDFGDGSATDTTTDLSTVTHVYTKSGSFFPKLVSYSKKGCGDSIMPTTPIVVNPKPKAAMTVSDTVVCYYDTLQFTGSGKSNVPIVRYEWKFDDYPGSTTDTSTERNPRYHFDSAGIHMVQLVVENANGCTDTIVKRVRNRDQYGPDPATIDYVTVSADNDITVAFEKQSAPDFKRYYLYRYRGNTKTLVKTSSASDDIKALDLYPNIHAEDSSYGYEIVLEDECGLLSQPSVLHQSILLGAVQTGPVSITLNWTPYIGWPSLQGYEIYRSEDGSGRFTKLGVTMDTTYLDSPVCDHIYTYYVQAINAINTAFISKSNRYSVKVNYVRQTTPLELYKTTVVDNSYTLTTWEKGIQPNIRYYSIDRWRPGYGWQEDYGTSVTTSFIDKNVDVNNLSYHYRVKAVDECGYESPVSNIGTSILLRSDIVDDARNFGWSNYNEWPAGVRQYLLQLRDNNGQFATVGIRNSNDTTYVDDSTHDEIYNGTCYRIVAIENAGGTDQDTSVSNIDCSILASRIWVPNVFTPNDDTKNELWRVKTVSVYSRTGQPLLDFNLRLFDRWGELVWETNNYEDGWDGKFHGAPAQEGLYMYKIKATGVDGKGIKLNGTVLLMR